MEAEIVKIVTGTFSNDESIRTQAEDALGRLDKGKFGINYKNHEIKLKYTRISIENRPWI